MTAAPVRVTPAPGPMAAAPERRTPRSLSGGTARGEAPSGQGANEPSHSTRGWSLERRLPLLILGLLTFVIVGFVVATYRELRDAAVDRTAERLEGLARETATNAARGQETRLATLQALGGSDVLHRALRSPEVGPALADSLARRLASASSQRDTMSLAWELWTAAGERRYRSRATTPRDSVMLAALRAAAVQRDSVQRSPLFGAGSQTHGWTALPVRSEGRPIGVLAELRRVGATPRAQQSLQRITGEALQVLYTNPHATEWATLAGAPVAAPFALPRTANRMTRVIDHSGAPQLVVRANVAGAPYVLVLLQSEASVLQRPRAFMRSLIGIGVALLALGTLAAWALSRRVTRPLADLGDAAEAMARGDYSYRVVATGGGAEMARLAHTFNVMASRIGDAHAVLAHQNAALQRANEAKTRFLAMMSHELRTPLNAIGGYADLLAMGLRGPTTAEQVEDLARIRRNKDQLLNIIADILHFSRVDAGHLALRLERLRVQDMFRALGDSVRPQFDAKQVALDFVPTDVTVHADAGRLQQILLNLLTNALSFTNPGGRVQVSASARNGWTYIAVRDTGLGIPREKLTEIFEPFVQVDASLTRRVGGTGLGLSIARELVEAMGGTIGVESVVGDGSTFLVSLPTGAGEVDHHGGHAG